MSRSLQTLLIARQGVLAPEFSSIEERLGMPGHTWEYYQVLRDVGGSVYSPDRDTLPWVRFNLRAYHEQSQRAMTGRVRSSRYERAEALSNQQAVRDIQTLTRTVRGLRTLLARPRTSKEGLRLEREASAQ